LSFDNECDTIKQTKKGDFYVKTNESCLLLRISLEKRIARHSFLCE